MSELREKVAAELARTRRKLRDAIKAAGLTQATVGARLGLARATVSAILGGRIHLTFENMSAILDVIGKSRESFFAELYGLSDTPKKPGD